MHSKYPACLKLSRKRWVVAGCCAAYVTGIGMIICTFLFSEEEVPGSAERYGSNYKDPYSLKHLIFIVFNVVSNFLLFTGQELAVVLICCIYHNLECAISDCKRQFAIVYHNSKLTPQVMCTLSSKLHHLASIISKTDQIVSPIAFNLLCAFLFQILVLTSLLTRESVILWHLFAGTYLGIALLFKVYIVVIFGSRINERFCDIRKVAASFPAFQTVIISEASSVVNHIALSQMVQILAENAQMTGLGIINIRKSVILSVICGFISYSVLLYQVFKE
ncbi:hypothetical protein HNY73_017631 [Argiope bruennichi]|uniref:Gustatory receptor n=1 Tax=Argiope bruennichi TaxID=94029 RepID=A0A8T0EBN7_ARGBR|nr:hypothetical protein HNY73_017631 [Argiope bruennichi]